MNKDISIEEIEIEKGIVYDDAYINEGSLPSWYDSIRRKKISQLSDGDLARLIRQNIYLEDVFDEIVKRLYKNPFGGEKYAGEIIEGILKYIEPLFWKQNVVLKNNLRDFLSNFMTNNMINNDKDLDDFEKKEIMQTINSLYEIIK